MTAASDHLQTDPSTGYTTLFGAPLGYLAPGALGKEAVDMHEACIAFMRKYYGRTDAQIRRRYSDALGNIEGLDPWKAETFAAQSVRVIELLLARQS